MSMLGNSIKEKTPYFSQKTGSSIHKTHPSQSIIGTTYLFGSFFGCYTANNNKLTETQQSFNKTGAQTIENLIHSKHYCDQISEKKSARQSEVQEIQKQQSTTEPTQLYSYSLQNSEFQSKPKPKLPPSTCEKLPELCIIQHEGKVLIARMCLHSVTLQQLAPNSEKKRKHSAKSSREGFFKHGKDEFLKEELNNTCTNATQLLEYSRISNPSTTSSRLIQKSFDDFLNFDSRKGRIISKIVLHVAKKARRYGTIILDAMTQTGIASVEFAKQGFQVLAMNRTLHYCKILKQHSTLCGLKDRIETLNQDFLEAKVRMVDLVFFNPATLVGPIEEDGSIVEEESFSIFYNLTPDILSFLEKALEISRNVVMLLPNKTDISELSLLFWRLYEKKRKTHPISVKIEYFKINRKLEAYLVYIGDIAQIKQEEERNILERFLLSDYPLDFKDEIPHNFQDFLQKLSPFSIYRIYHQHISDSSFKESYFSQFLWICYHDEKLLCKEEYELLLSFERKYIESNKHRNKSAYYNDRANESISPKQIGMNNFDILTFSVSQSNKIPSEKNLKIISSESPQRQSPCFKSSCLSKMIKKDHDKTLMTQEYHTNNKKKTESENESSGECEEDFICKGSSYSDLIANSLSPPSDFKAKILKIANIGQNYSFVERRSEFRQEVNMPVSMMREAGHKTMIGESETTI